MKKIVAVVGPTGSGKTKLGIELAKKFNGVILSADSRQVYQGLDAATNKEGDPGHWNSLTCRTIDNVPQLLIDIALPGTRFTLADWLTAARKIVEVCEKNRTLPIVVGGTGLYVSALLEGYEPGQGRHSKQRRNVDFRSIVLMPEVLREKLFHQSDQRLERIFDSLITEVKHLLRNGISQEWLEKIGLDYRYAIKYIAGKLSREEAIMRAQFSNHAYIRRQLTWWRHHGEIEFVKSEIEVINKVRSWL